MRSCEPPREPEAARETFNIGATEFGTVRSDLQALIDHAGSSSRLQPVPVKPAEIALRGLELMRVSPLAEWHYKTAHKDSFVDVTKAQQLLGLAAAAVEPRRADRDVRLVSRKPRASRCGRRHAPRALEPAGARSAQAPVVIFSRRSRSARAARPRRARRRTRGRTCRAQRRRSLDAAAHCRAGAGAPGLLGRDAGVPPSAGSPASSSRSSRRTVTPHTSGSDRVCSTGERHAARVHGRQVHHRDAHGRRFRTGDAAARA